MSLAKLISFFLIIFSFNSFALNPEERLEDPKDEARAMKLFTEIRCLVCEAQSIESSNTEFSASLRKVIRIKIAQGKNDEEIKTELRKEFGDQILMSAEPGKTSQTLPWILPFIFAGLLALFLGRKFFVKQK